MNSSSISRSRIVNLTICTTLTLVSLASCSKKEVAHRETHDENIVALTKENLEHVEIKTQLVKLGDLETTLKAAGRVSNNVNKTAKVTSTLEGRLTQLNVDLNDRVKAGDVLALVQTPELLGKALELKAPIDGVIVERKSTVGELVGKDAAIYTISDPADLWVLAEIKERDIGQVQIGQDAAFTVLAYADEKFHGKVTRISNTVGPESRTLEVRIETRNDDGRLKAGMFADVEITTSVARDVVLVPDAAVQRIDEDQVVFVPLDANRFEKRVVKLGAAQGAMLQLLSGVKPGEKVVTAGSFILKSQLLKGEIGEKD